MSWYRVYRPATLAQLHLDSVRATLQNLLDGKYFPHALLFAGAKGTGKTSAARILSAIVNDPANEAAVDVLFFGKKAPAGKVLKLQEPDLNQDIVRRIYKGNSMAVNEIDAASYRGIDDIRQLKERVYLAPQEGKMSVYILDEVHMLTTEAFNALLKMLEEPPSHALFILATTELQKIPDTIVSRCLVVRFQRATDAELTAALTQILDKEKIAYDPAAVSVVVTAADGSFRDGVKLLESVAAGQSRLTVETVQAMLHITDPQILRNVIDTIVAKDERRVAQIFEELRAQNINPVSFQKSLLQFLHRDLMKAVGAIDDRSIYSAKVSHFLLSQFQTVPVESVQSIPLLALELKALEIIFKGKTADKEKEKEKEKKSDGGSGSSPTISRTMTATTITPELRQELANVVMVQPIIDMTSTELPTESLTLAPVPVSIDRIETTAPSHALDQNWINGSELIAKWEDFLRFVRTKNSSIEAVLRSSRPIAGEEGKAKIEVYYQFHREQLQQPKFQRLLDECVQLLLGGKILFEFVLAKQAQPGAVLSTISGNVNEDDHLIQLAKEMLV